MVYHVWFIADVCYFWFNMHVLREVFMVVGALIMIVVMVMVMVMAMVMISIMLWLRLWL